MKVKVRSEEGQGEVRQGQCEVREGLVEVREGQGEVRGRTVLAVSLRSM